MNHTNAIASVHGLIRTMERTGKDEELAQKKIEDAWCKGFQAKAQALERARRRRKRLGCAEDTLSATYELIYREYLFIFTEDRELITMYRLPRGYFHRHFYDGKQQIRNIRKYSRKYYEDSAEE